mmetsp:Transcript_13243/g.35449  ORF Transcript_13243/g.35449 Transcript_13243/m.35449 type:complete len:248 (+) Transcript_13243:692-1435(+)
MAGNSVTPSVPSTASLCFSTSVMVTKYLPLKRFATWVIIALCFWCTASNRPSDSGGNKLQTMPLPASMYLSKVLPSRTPKSGMMLSFKKEVTLSLSPHPASNSTGSSPWWVRTTFWKPETRTKYHAALRLFALAASSKPGSRDSACSTTRGFSAFGAGAKAVSVTAAPSMDTTQSTIPSEVRPPSNSCAWPSSNQTKVGYPFTPCFDATSLSAVASTFARGTPLAFRVAAAFSYSGSSFLQCPHHGA